MRNLCLDKAQVQSDSRPCVAVALEKAQATQRRSSPHGWFCNAVQSQISLKATVNSILTQHYLPAELDEDLALAIILSTFVVNSPTDLV